MKRCIRATLWLACCAGLGVWAAACTDPEPLPQLSLHGPTDAVLGRTCLKDGERLAPSACGEEDTAAERLVEYAYVTNRLGDSVAVVPLDEGVPGLQDTRADIPGVSHILVGRGPTHAAASDDGNLLFVYNEIDRDLSVVNAESQRELGREPVGALVTGMFHVSAREATDAEPAREEALWMLLPEVGELRRATWAATCDGEPVWKVGCDPRVVVEAEVVLRFAPGSLPRHAALGADGRSLAVLYADRPWLDLIALEADPGRRCLEGGEAPCVVQRVGLTWGCSDGLDNDGDGVADAQDPQCLSPSGAESDGGVGRTRATACNDGLDNDGDGATDAQDADCLSADDGSELGAVVAAPCLDGVDNDGDGFVDAQDPECASGEPSAREGRALACADGVDNDGDGLVDAEDEECEGAGDDDEARAGVECADGVDNDGDGAVDLADPSCGSPSTGSEFSPPSACADGSDNDGDGQADYPRDPGCYGAGGGSEVYAPRRELGPLGVDPGGRLVYVLDRAESQVLVVDLEAGRLLDVSEGRPWLPTAGVPVGRLPRSVLGRRIVTDTLALAEGTEVPGVTGQLAEGGTLFREVLVANVGTTRGLMYYVEAMRHEWVVDAQGTVLYEIYTPTLRLTDDENSSATSSGVTCSLNEEVRERVRAARGGDVRGEILCTDEALPRLLPLDVACVAGEDGCVCEEQDGAQVCARVGGPVELATRDARRLVYDSEALSVLDQTAAEPDDFYATDEGWELTYEGLLVERPDAVVEAALPGVLRVGGDLCAGDVRVGDLASLDRVVPDPDGDEGACAAFEGKELLWEVAEVRAGAVRLSVLSDEALAGLNPPRVGGSGRAVVAELPNRACFHEGVTFSARAREGWVVRGERTGLRSAQRSVGGVCAPAYDAELPYAGRVEDSAEGTEFRSPELRFKLASGVNEEGQVVRPPQDFALRFTTRSRFLVTVLEVGPSPAKIQRLDAQDRDYLFVLDESQDEVRVYVTQDGVDSGLTVLY